MKTPCGTLLFAVYRPFHLFCMEQDVIVSSRARVTGFPSGPIKSVTTDKGVALKIATPRGTMQCVGIAAPAPGVEEAIQTTRRANADLAPLATTRFHMVCTYTSYAGTGIQATFDLLEFAHGLARFGLLGMIHTSANQCFDVNQIRLLVQHRRKLDDASCLAVFVNRIPLVGDGVTLYVSRGAREIGSRNVCLVDTQQMEVQLADDILYRLVEYVRQGAQIAPGDPIEFGRITLVAERSGEFADQIMHDADDDVLQVRIVG